MQNSWLFAYNVNVFNLLISLKKFESVSKNKSDSAYNYKHNRCDMT